MDHCMTVAAQRHQVPDGVDNIITTQFRDRRAMMYLDVAIPQVAVEISEIEATALTSESVVLNAGSPIDGAALIAVYLNPELGTLWQTPDGVIGGCIGLFANTLSRPKQERSRTKRRGRPLPLFRLPSCLNEIG